MWPLSDVFGHHRVSCAQAGGWEGVDLQLRVLLPVLAGTARGRVATNLLVRDLDFPVPIHDARRLEVVVDGFPLFGGAQICC